MLTSCRNLLFGACVAIVAVSCGKGQPELSETKFDSGYSIGMDGVIADGVILTTTTGTASLVREVKQQLYYTMGQLNHWNSVADLNRSVVNITTIVPAVNGLSEVHYNAKLFVSWARHRPVPASVPLVMPAQMDRVSEFVANHADCRDDFSHDPEVGNFWYYYRPEASGCALRNGGVAGEDAMEVRRFGMTMTVSAENTDGKFPEYAKVWEDGQLVVTAMFGKAEAGATEASDAGISSYNAMYRGLLQAFGQPVSQVPALAPGALPGPTVDDVEMVFNTARGPLKVSIMLLEGVLQMTSAQTTRYNTRTRDSDFVSYNGHSGLGANIRGLARMGDFQPNQYQLFFVNGCDTFAYVDNSLRDAHAVQNPGFGASKYFDIITNSMPSYFHMNARGVTTIINALIGQQLSYRKILQQIDWSQMPVVTGEEDNMWPQPF